jgi:CRISPR/Cas system-associated protein Cas5 (RAMP superfamily)
LEDFLGALWEALRIAREEEVVEVVEVVVVAIRVRQIAPRWGRRN